MKRLGCILLVALFGAVAFSFTEKEVPMVPVAAVSTAEIPKAKPVFLQGEDYDPEEGADVYQFEGDNPDSMYYKNPDFYQMKSEGSLILLPEFKTMQQTTEWSSGPAVARMVLAHYGKTDVTEMGLARAIETAVDTDAPGAEPGSANRYYDYGTTVEKLYKYFKSLEGFNVIESSFRKEYYPAELLAKSDDCSPTDFENLKPTFCSSSLYYTENSQFASIAAPDAKDSYFVKWLTGHLKAGRPIMVDWANWDGNWQAIIGYDSMGTPGIADDIIIFADPYDTSDGWQDGYSYFPLERFFTMWNDRSITPKPYQMQPFIIIDKVK